MFWNILLFSSFNLIFGLYSHLIKERLFLSESLVSMLFGILIGPAGTGLIEQIFNNEEEMWKFFMILARFVMTFQTMAAGISLPR